MTADDAGEDRDRFCGAKKRQSEGWCHRPKGWGTTHPGFGRCKLHGGSTAALTKVANAEQAAKLVEAYGARQDIGATEAMEELIGRTYGHMVRLAAYIASAESIGDIDRFTLERYDVERKLLSKLTKDSHQAGIAERQTTLAEEQGRIMAGVVRNVMADLIAALADAGVSMELLVRIQTERVPDIARHRLLEGGSGVPA